MTRWVSSFCCSTKIRINKSLRVLNWTREMGERERQRLQCQTKLFVYHIKCILSKINYNLKWNENDLLRRNKLIWRVRMDIRRTFSNVVCHLRRFCWRQLVETLFLFLFFFFLLFVKLKLVQNGIQVDCLKVRHCLL